MIKYLRRFLCSLGFLTRLGPALMLDDEDFIATTTYAAASGFVLGLVIVTPFSLGFLQSQPWVQAWLAVAANVYLTRGLHYDGFSDVADAAGNHVSPERFWEILKDSRIGAFGALSLILVLAGQGIFYQTFFKANAYYQLLWLFPFSRFGGVFFAMCCRSLVRPTGSGRPFYLGATPFKAFLCALPVFSLGFFFFPLYAGLSFTLFLPCVFFLRRYATRVGGANGDFIGCAKLLAELCAGLAFAMTL